VPKIAIVDYGVGNLRSVKNGLERAGAETTITHSPREIANSDALILPGVGAFIPAVKNLQPIKREVLNLVGEGKPLLGICLGMQLLFSRSYEGGVTEGLNFFEGEIVPLPNTVKTPHMGWNALEIVKDNLLLSGIEDGAYVYFVHSYVPKVKDTRDVVAYTDYGVRFPSVIASGNVYATQFHPEKSSDNGLRILKNFVEIVKR